MKALQLMGHAILRKARMTLLIEFWCLFPLIGYLNEIKYFIVTHLVSKKYIFIHFWVSKRSLIDTKCTSDTWWEPWYLFAIVILIQFKPN